MLSHKALLFYLHIYIQQENKDRINNCRKYNLNIIKCEPSNSKRKINVELLFNETDITLNEHILLNAFGKLSGITIKISYTEYISKCYVSIWYTFDFIYT